MPVSKKPGVSINIKECKFQREGDLESKSHYWYSVINIIVLFIQYGLPKHVFLYLRVYQ